MMPRMVASGQGVPTITGKPRGRLAAAAVRSLEEYVRKRMEDAKVPELDPNESIVMRQASREQQDGIILQKLRLELGDEFRAGRRLEIVSPELTEGQLDVIMEAVPGLNRDETRKAVSKIPKEKLPDPNSAENASRIQEWNQEVAVTAHGTPARSGHSSPVQQFIKPEMTARSAAVELAVDKVRRAEEEVGNGKALLEVAMMHPSFQPAEIAYQAATDAWQEADDRLQVTLDMLVERFPKFPLKATMEEVDTWKRDVRKNMGEADRKELDGLIRALRGALKDQSERTTLAQQAKEEFEAQRQLQVARVRELEEQRTRALEELYRAKRELEVMERQAREIQAISNEPPASIPRAASTGLLRQLHEGKASRLKRRALVQDGSSEMLMFLPIKKLLLLYKVTVGLPTSKKEVQDMLNVKQGQGLGVPEAETLSSCVHRFMRAHRMAVMYGIYSDTRMGLLPGLKNGSLRRYATNEFVREPQKYEDPRAVVTMLEKAAVQFQLVEESGRAKPYSYYGPRQTEVSVAVNVSDHASPPASSSTSSVTKASSNSAAAGESSSSTAKPGGKTLKADWKQGPHACSRCKAWHDEAVPCRPICTLCNRRHEPGKPCWQKCGDCGRYHPQGDCRGTDWKGKGRGRGRDDGRGRGDGGRGPDKAAPGTAYVAEEWGATPEEVAILFEGMPEYPGDEFGDDWEQGSIFVVGDQTGDVIDFDAPATPSATPTSRIVPSAVPASRTSGTGEKPSGAVHIAERSMGGPLPVGFPIRQSSRLQEKAVATRVLEAEKKAAAAGTAVNNKGQQGKRSSNRDTGASSSAGTVIAAGESTSQGSKATPYTLLVLKEQKDRELLQKLIEASGEEGLGIWMVPGKVLQGHVMSSSLKIRPTVAVTAAIVDMLQNMGPCRNPKEERPMLPYLKKGVATFRIWGTKLAYTVDQLLLDSGATDGATAMKVVQQCNLPLEKDQRVLSAAAGPTKTEGRIPQLVLELEVGNGEKTLVPFGGTVLGGKQSSYDAILGRKQMHQLGMVLDFYGQKCYIRPWLDKGSTEVRELPMDCVTKAPVDEAALAYVAAYDEQRQAEAVLLLSLLVVWALALLALWMRKAGLLGLGQTAEGPAEDTDAEGDSSSGGNGADSEPDIMSVLPSGTVVTSFETLERQHFRRNARMYVPHHLQNGRAFPVSMYTGHTLSDHGNYYAGLAPSDRGSHSSNEASSDSSSMPSLDQGSGESEQEVEEEEGSDSSSLPELETDSGMSSVPELISDVSNHSDGEDSSGSPPSLVSNSEASSMPSLIPDSSEDADDDDDDDDDGPSLDGLSRIPDETGAVGIDGVPQQLYEGYQQQQLMRSGDVQENPGPSLLDPGRFSGIRDVLHMLICCLALLVVAAEHLYGVKESKKWQCYWSGLAALSVVMKMMPTLWIWSRAKHLPEWQGQYHLKARKQRQYHKAKKLERWQDELLHRGTRWEQRLRKTKLLPAVMTVIWILVASLCITGIHAVSQQLRLGQVCDMEAIMGWDPMAAQRNVWQGMNERGYGVAAAAVMKPEHGCFTAGFSPDAAGASGSADASALEGYDPVGTKDELPEAEGVYRDPEHQFQFAENPAFDEDTQQQLREAVRSRKKAFAYSMTDLPGYKEKVSWQLKTDKPVRVPCFARKFSPLEYDIMDAKVKELEAAGMVEEVEATSAYAAMPVIAAKKNAFTHQWDEHRFCVNFIPLNAQMVTNSYAAPLPEQIFEMARGCKVFGTIDLRAGFHQLVPTEECQKHLCFWHRRRLMKYTRLPFGIKNALPIFQQVIDKVLLEGGCSTFATAYVDDILIMSKTPGEHVQHTCYYHRNK